MEILSYALAGLVLVWVLSRQFSGRFVSFRRAVVLPVVLVLVGLDQAYSADIRWTAAAVGVVAVDLLLMVGLGAARGAAVRLTERDGYLYQRGGWPLLVLWVVSIGARVGVAVLTTGDARVAAATTVALSVGVSLAAQYAVLSYRVRADGRPLRPGARDRRGAVAGSRLDP